jgi:lipoate-protein ligase A
VIGRYDRDDGLIAAMQRQGRPHLSVRAVTDVCVVLGRGSKPEIELIGDAIEAAAVPLLRRDGGGCSVVLDPGNVVVSAACRLPGLGGSKEAFAALSAWLIEGLARCGIRGVQRQETSDLVLGDRKIGGACIHRSRDLLVYGTTLLVAPEVELSERFLRHPPREPAYRRGRSHRDFMGALAAIDRSLDAATLAGRLQPALESLPWPIIGS